MKQFKGIVLAEWIYRNRNHFINLKYTVKSDPDKFVILKSIRWIDEKSQLEFSQYKAGGGYVVWTQHLKVDIDKLIDTDGDFVILEGLKAFTRLEKLRNL